MPIFSYLHTVYGARLKSRANISLVVFLWVLLGVCWRTEAAAKTTEPSATLVADIKSIAERKDGIVRATEEYQQASQPALAKAAEAATISELDKKIADLNVSITTLTGDELQKAIDRLKALQTQLSAAKSARSDYEQLASALASRCSDLRNVATSLRTDLESIEKTLEGANPADLNSPAFTTQLTLLGDALTLIERSFQRLESSNPPCNIPSRLSFTAYYGEVARMANSKPLIAIAEQKADLQALRTHIQVFVRDVDQDKIFSSVGTKLSLAVSNTAGAAVRSMIAQLESAKSLQLIKEPEQSWERVTWGEAGTWLGSALTIGSVGVRLQDKSPSGPFFKNTANVTGLIGVGIIVIGQTLGKANSTGQLSLIQDAASRVAANRMVGLSVQRMLYEIDNERDRAQSAAATVVAPVSDGVNIQPLRDSTASVAREIDALVAELSKEKPQPLEHGSLINLRNEIQKWQTQAHSTINVARIRSAELVTAYEKAQTALARFGDTVAAMDASTKELKDLMGPDMVKSMCKAPEDIDCIGDDHNDPASPNTANRFCTDPKFAAPGRAPHVAQEFLTPKGRKELFTVGVCSALRAGQASDLLNTATSNVAAASVEIDEWQRIYGPTALSAELQEAINLLNKLP